jgi:ribosomal protein S18 acetylase RimI-like enzyme
MSSIRRAVESDLQRIHPLLDQLLPAGLEGRRPIWSAALAQDGYAAWIAEVDGAPAGFLDLVLFPDVAHGGRIGLIHNLVVDARFRGRGLGRSLLQEAIHHSRQLGAAELHVWTDADNAPALGLYEGLGFEPRAVLLELQT